MASVSFDDLWLNPVDDLGSGRPFHLHGLIQQPEVQGEFRLYAGGRQRLIIRAGGLKEAPYTVTLKLCDAAEVAQLRAWAGTVLCVRDCNGGKFFGAYLKPQIEWVLADTANVTLQITEVSHDEAV